MKTKLLARLLITLLVAVPVLGTACETEQPSPQAQQSAVPSPGNIGATPVPNVELDSYFYFRQENPTTLPAAALKMSRDVKVVSAAIWGVPSLDSFAFGMGVTLTSAADAALLNDKLKVATAQGWTKIAGDTVYAVFGSGDSIESLKSAISNNDFIYFDNKDLLEAASTLPDQGATKLAAVWVSKPSKALINLASQYGGANAPEQADTIISMAKITAIAAGAYSPQEIDIAKLVEFFQNGGKVSDLDLGLLIVVKSSLPGILVEPVIAGFLKDSDFTKTDLGDLSVYQGSFSSNAGQVPILLRLSENRVFLAMAGQEIYAETLIKSVK